MDSFQRNPFEFRSESSPRSSSQSSSSTLSSPSRKSSTHSAEFRAKVDLWSKPGNGKVEVKDFICTNCRKKFVMDSDLRNHRAACHSPGKMKCPKCPAKFWSKKLVANHKSNTHSKRPEAKYRCAECQRGFKDKNLMKRHIWDKHRLRESYFCECKKGFEFEYLLKEHRMVMNHPKQGDSTEAHRIFVEINAAYQQEFNEDLPDDEDDVSPWPPADSVAPEPLDEDVPDDDMFEEASPVAPVASVTPTSEPLPETIPQSMPEKIDTGDIPIPWTEEQVQEWLASEVYLSDNKVVADSSRPEISVSPMTTLHSGTREDPIPILDFDEYDLPPPQFYTQEEHEHLQRLGQEAVASAIISPVTQLTGDFWRTAM